ncbi:SPRY domain containing protein [Echinococcus multilocularis]|uniref:SPRY domain containing protein n=1 Tax=Echinococcus multilocularis TaxID=6211 RepID=A0A068XYB7_ECHMU|nr:SPRY domain containing protein [Echinococcus multilocularis]
MNETLKSKNGTMFQSKATLPDGTIEITDTLPKQDYYKSLRRNSVSSPGSQFTINNSTNVYDAISGYRKSKAIEYKPSGKQVQCSVLMLEGIEQIYTIDKHFYGIHLFKLICEKLELTETEYFGLTYRGNQNVDMWLKMDEKITKQLERNPWRFEFRFKFYPAHPEYLKDDLTRYFLCLQIRQDIICGQLPCSFNTYVILGAYVIQSEAGDWDSEVHEGIEYLYNVPFAPKNLQTPELLIRIAELHQKLKGRTPEQADRMFLENARRMALYGVHLHRVKSVTGDDLSLGVYHAGVLVYRGRLRMQRYTWARIVELSYRGKDFIMVVRPVIFDEYIESPSGGARRRTSVSSIKGSLSGNEISSIERSTAKQRSRSAKPASVAQRNKTLTFKCLNGELAKRLYNVVIDHHTFFRLREGGNSRRLNLQPGFGTRKYHYNSRPQIFEDNESGVWTLNRDGGLPPTGSIRRVAAQRRPEQYAKSLVTLMTPVASRKGTGFRAPCASIEDADSIRNGYQGGANTIGHHESSVLMEESYAPVKSSHPAPGSSIKAPAVWTLSSERPPQHFRQMAPPLNVTPRMPRPELSRQHWQMSPADCTQGLGMDFYGTDVATMMDAGWQGSRTNRGIKGPGAYYYEVSVLEDGDVRVGWSTNDASLMLGMDSHGYGYGAAENGEGSSVRQSAMGRLVQNGKVHEMGFPASVSDVIGCFLQLQKNPNGDGLEGNVMWSHNGQLVTSPHANLVCIPPEIATDSAFFPAVSLRDARVSLNFGEKPFVHSPEQISGGRVKWMAPVEVPAERMVQNVNSGWRINQFDTTSTLNLIVSEDGRMVQAKENEWQGFRANKGVFEAGKYYYEVEMVEDCGYARVGWSLPTGDLQLGADNLGYGFGFAPDGSPAKKVFNCEVEDYGVKVKVGDVVGCFLDLDNGSIQWSVNGEVLPPAYYMDSSFITHDKTIFFPTASLFCTTLEVNYGDRPFKYQPSEEWYPLFAAADEFVKDSPKWPIDINTVRQPHATTERVESDILYPGVTITVTTRENQAQSSDTSPVSSQRRTSGHTSMEGEDQEDEDTVIDVQDEQDRGVTSTPSRATPQQSATDTPLTYTSTDAQRVTEEDDPEVTVEYYTNEEGQRVKKIIQKQRKVVTTIHKESVERFETTRIHHSSSADQSGWQNQADNSTVNEDEAMNKAIHQATKLDSDTFVVNGSTNIRSDVIPTTLTTTTVTTTTTKSEYTAN